MTVNIDQTIDMWKTRLLDLGKRNRLINFKETKASTLFIEVPDLKSLWDKVVDKNRSLKFPYSPKLEGDSEFLFDDDRVLLQGDIKTNKEYKTMQKILRTLRSKAKLAIDEQGINILYLAFGFLRWKETNNSLDELSSPLVLVPVSLTVDSIISPFVLKATDDEIVMNPTLKYKMKNDFGLDLPDFDDEKMNIDEYLDAILHIIKNNNTWDVERKVSLSYFSFLKLNMYSDLENNRAHITSHPIVRAIAGDPSALEMTPDDLGNYDYDKEKPKDVFQVVDADSSQQDAILYAKRGVSFVLQGPPGTGKSQTITNIISECIAQGNKVLFVSEKKAALDVVYKRLSDAGLKEFCLVLHSHKANKAAVLAQLREALALVELPAHISNNAQSDLDTLYRDREILNKYAEELFSTVEPLNKNIYEVNGILASLRHCGDLIFSIKDVGAVSSDKFDQFLHVIKSYKNAVEQMTTSIVDNPWRGTTIQRVTHELRHDINSRFSHLSDKLMQYAEEIKGKFDFLGLSYIPTYKRMEEAKYLFAISKSSPLIPLHWINGTDLLALYDDISNHEKQKAEYDGMITDLNSYYAVVNDNGIAHVGLDSRADLISIDAINAEIKQLRHLLNNDPVLCKIKEVVQSRSCNLLSERRQAEDQLKGLNVIKKELLKDFNDGILCIDGERVLESYRSLYAPQVDLMRDVLFVNGAKQLRPFELIPGTLA